jgi:glycosyltransferase involved in cell wall biosynthesis
MMSVAEDEQIVRRAARTLVGSTVLQAVSRLDDDRVGHATLNLALALLRSGARAIVAGEKGALVGELQALGGEWMEFAFSTSHPLRRRANVNKLRELVDSERIELVHAHGSEAARVMTGAMRRKPVPLVTSYFGVPGPPQSFGVDPAVKGSVVLAQSVYAANMIVKHHSIARERIVVVPPSIDTDWFAPASISADRIAALRHAWRIHPEERIILAPGRLAPWQGQLTLVDAARILFNGGLSDTVFVIAGDGPADADYAKEIEARVIAQGLGHTFRRVGHCRDMPAAYAAADIVVVATERAASFDDIAAEAQAMGRPVVASDVGALSEIVLAPPLVPPEARTGWLVQPRDTFALARALAEAIETEPAERRSMGARARAVADQTFAPLRVAAAVLDVYDALLEGDA